MIILDTNFLVYLMKYKIAHELEIYRKELVTPIAVINELKDLSESAESILDRQASQIALIFIEKWAIKIIKTKGKADEAIKEIAIKNKAKVATMDSFLARDLKKEGIKLLKIRQKKHIIEE